MATQEDKMVLSCPLGTIRHILQEKFPQRPYKKSLVTTIFRSRWLDIGQVLSFFVCSCTEKKLRSINLQKKLGQYLAILPSGLVNNPYTLPSGLVNNPYILTSCLVNNPYILPSGLVNNLYILPSGLLNNPAYRQLSSELTDFQNDFCLGFHYLICVKHQSRK